MAYPLDCSVVCNQACSTCLGWHHDSAWRGAFGSSQGACFPSPCSTPSGDKSASCAKHVPVLMPLDVQSPLRPGFYPIPMHPSLSRFGAGLTALLSFPARKLGHAWFHSSGHTPGIGIFTLSHRTYNVDLHRLAS